MGHSRSRGVCRNWLTDAGTGVILVGHMVDRVIEVEVVVVHPVHRIAHIVRSMAKLKRHQMNAQAVTLLFPALV